MGIWIEMQVAPKVPTFLSREQFCEFLQDLLHRGIVQMPCALLGGDMSAEPSLGIANLFINHHYEHGKWVVTPLHYPPGTVIPTDEGSVTIYYYGEDEVELFKALFEAPYGELDLCAWFSNLDFENEDIANTYRYGTDVVVYALTTIRSIVYETEQQAILNKEEDDEGNAGAFIGFEEHPVQCYFATTAKSGPEKTCKAMDKIFTRHFGNDFLVGCFYS